MGGTRQAVVNVEGTICYWDGSCVATAMKLCGTYIDRECDEPELRVSRKVQVSRGALGKGVAEPRRCRTIWPLLYYLPSLICFDMLAHCHGANGLEVLPPYRHGGNDSSNLVDALWLFYVRQTACSGKVSRRSFCGHSKRFYGPEHSLELSVHTASEVYRMHCLNAFGRVTAVLPEAVPLYVRQLTGLLVHRS
ncbi:hypothetical protein EJ06DRAFT_324045 [Trichodelitschia bisporula]|uniref:Uncharacterized protein n=1 Tax=Trichodelitschia bisporula TaxID=703511 RepID=A0A6G1I4L4_9PEZI|nr:hypothetical protein EJ06DRAFT_324045 [Trichodelitschia bisporula]